MLEFFRLFCYLLFCWVTVKIFWKLFIAFKTFVLPRVVGEYNLIEKFGSWAVITGSSDGIGKELAKELARRGLNIVLISRTAEKLQRTASEIESEFNVKTKWIVADFCDGPVVYEHIKTELENIPVAVLVNNIAITLPRFFCIDEMTEELCWRMMNANIAPGVMMTNLILPQMKKRRKGAIINISSASQDLPLVFNGLYSPSKAFMKHFTQLLQSETAEFGITVQLLAPFFVKTNMLKLLPTFYKLKTMFIPNGETYAKHAIKTLGFSGHTTGYWLHGLWYFWLVEVVPFNIVVDGTKLFLVIIRTRFEKKYKNTMKRPTFLPARDEYSLAEKSK